MNFNHILLISEYADTADRIGKVKSELVGQIPATILIMSDDAHFLFSGHLNEQNSRYWRTQNPPLTHELSTKNVWCIHAGNIIGSFFIIVTAKRYIEMIRCFRTLAWPYISTDLTAADFLWEFFKWKCEWAPNDSTSQRLVWKMLLDIMQNTSKRAEICVTNRDHSLNYMILQP